MAYFKSNEPEDTRRTTVLPAATEEADDSSWDGYDDGLDDPGDEYDDGLDDSGEEYEEELTEEEKEEIRKIRARTLFGAGNLTGIIVGSVLILVLLLLLFFMINFVWTDLSDRFRLYGNKF